MNAHAREPDGNTHELPGDTRAASTDELFADIDYPIAAAVSAKWNVESEKRIPELEDGSVTAVSLSEARRIIAG